MEEKELLRTLSIFIKTIIICTFSSALASGDINIQMTDTDAGFAISLTRDAKQRVIEQSKEDLKKFLTENPNAEIDLDFDISNVIKPKLYVFVSSSMPITLLTSYYREAAKYSAALVFKGLPNGSFKDLASLVSRMSENNESQLAGAMIDDEAFKRFEVTSVPTFILVKEEECFEMTSCKISYDKISGNIGIRSALEEFTKSGELQFEAHEMLENRKKL